MNAISNEVEFDLKDFKKRQNPYDVLGLSLDVTNEQLKSAYRRLATKYHPDYNPNNLEAEEKTKQINAAYNYILNIRKGKIDNNPQFYNPHCFSKNTYIALMYKLYCYNDYTYNKEDNSIIRKYCSKLNNIVLPKTMFMKICLNINAIKYYASHSNEFFPMYQEKLNAIKRLYRELTCEYLNELGIDPTPYLSKVDYSLSFQSFIEKLKTIDKELQSKRQKYNTFLDRLIELNDFREYILENVDIVLDLDTATVNLVLLNIEWQISKNTLNQKYKTSKHRFSFNDLQNEGFNWNKSQSKKGVKFIGKSAKSHLSFKPIKILYSIEIYENIPKKYVLCLDSQDNVLLMQFSWIESINEEIPELTKYKDLQRLREKILLPIEKELIDKSLQSLLQINNSNSLILSFYRMLNSIIPQKDSLRLAIFESEETYFSWYNDVLSKIKDLYKNFATAYLKDYGIEVNNYLDTLNFDVPFRFFISQLDSIVTEHLKIELEVVKPFMNALERIVDGNQYSNSNNAIIGTYLKKLNELVINIKMNYQNITVFLNEYKLTLERIRILFLEYTEAYLSEYGIDIQIYINDLNFSGSFNELTEQLESIVFKEEQSKIDTFQNKCNIYFDIENGTFVLDLNDKKYVISRTGNRVTEYRSKPRSWHNYIYYLYEKENMLFIPLEELQTFNSKNKYKVQFIGKNGVLKNRSKVGILYSIRTNSTNYLICIDENGNIFIELYRRLNELFIEIETNSDEELNKYSDTIEIKKGLIKKLWASIEKIINQKSLS